MSESNCTRVREAAAGGTYDHDHINACAECRRFADSLALVDRLLADVEPVDIAPPEFARTMVVRLIQADDRARRQRAVASVATVLAIAAGAGWIATQSSATSLVGRWTVGVLAEFPAVAGAAMRLASEVGPASGSVSTMLSAALALLAVGLVVRLAAAEL